MYEVLDKDTLKAKIPPHLPWQNIVRSQKLAWWKSPFNGRSTGWKPAADARLLLRLHAAVSVSREQHALNRSRWSLQTYMFSVSLPCVHLRN